MATDLEEDLRAFIRGRIRAALTPNPLHMLHGQGYRPLNEPESPSKPIGDAPASQSLGDKPAAASS